MRNPDNLAQCDDISNHLDEVFKISDVPAFDIEDYDMSNPKEFRRFTDNIERIIRTSLEYRQYVKFLRENMNMNQCSFFEHVSNAESFKIKIHLHHEPITLFDVVMAVYNKKCANREYISENMIAKEAMYQHYMLRIGIIPLSETAHELVHNQYLFVPSTAVMGKYWDFIDIYHDYIDPEVLDKLKKIEEATKTYNFDDAKKILGLHLIHIDTEDVFGKTDLGAIKQSLEERIDEIKNEVK